MNAAQRPVNRPCTQPARGRSSTRLPAPVLSFASANGAPSSESRSAQAHGMRCTEQVAMIRLNGACSGQPLAPSRSHRVPGGRRAGRRHGGYRRDRRCPSRISDVTGFHQLIGQPSGVFPPAAVRDGQMGHAGRSASWSVSHSRAGEMMKSSAPSISSKGHCGGCGPSFARNGALAPSGLGRYPARDAARRRAGGSGRSQSV